MPVKPASPGTIHTIGTAARSPQAFLALLEAFGIEVLVDVRSVPASRFEHFSRENLAALCRGRGVDYRWMGESLGGLREGGYEAHMATPAFLQGIERLEELARERVCALCCAERLPWRCHRWRIAGFLERRGWRVLHIIDEGSAVRHAGLPL
ncbi:MAG: DUF488 domain-containing protein [Methanomicrobiaceae archaeon]|nr:DUF488 domain-containing protein [Methanomicrobiaceae archaeon]